MNIAEKPIAAIIGRLTSTGDGIHMIAHTYKKGVRLHTHMHREAQLVYAASGTMQVTTPKGRWLVPPDRAVWVPARLEHAIDVLADIEMRTLYFDLAWLKRELGPDVPIHFTRFHPQYLLKNLPPTPVQTLETAKAIADSEGLHFAYIGNVPGHPAEHTYCPKCRITLIERVGFTIGKNNLKKGRCPKCDLQVPGVWES